MTHKTKGEAGGVDRFSRYYNMAGEPISLTEWGEMFEKPGARNVARTELPGGVVVSTVLLGIDHCLSGKGKPIIFETMVFGGCLNEDMRRYETLEQARAGHKKMVAAARRALKGEK